MNQRILIICVILLASSSFFLWVEKVQAAETEVEYIEYGEGLRIPATQDPCQLKGSAKEEAAKYVKKYKHIQNEVDRGKAILGEINARKFDNIEHLSTIIELSLYNWACQNGYELSNTRSLGIYFRKKDLTTNQGIFIGVMADEYLPSQGLRKGSASLALDRRGRFGDTYHLQVILTKLNPEPTEKVELKLNEAAQKIIDEVVDYSYQWGREYYSTIIEEAKLK